MPCTFADLPFSLSYAVFPSRATSNLVNKNPACSAIHGQMECVASIFTPHRPSMSLRIVLIIPCTDWIALSTIPLLFELPTGLFSMIILDPLVIALIVLHDAIKLVNAGSLSDFTMMSTDSSPISRSHAISLRQIHSPVVFLGTTVLSTALVSLFSQPRMPTSSLPSRLP